MNMQTSLTTICSTAICIATFLALISNAMAFDSAQPSVQNSKVPTVGQSVVTDEIKLPGSELEVIPISDRTPLMVLRIVDAFPHGDSYRYRFQYQGLEPGTFNLVEFLRRKDGSELGELPAYEVAVRSTLPAGQIEPNPLEKIPPPGLGGYTVVATVLAIAWTAGLLGLIFWGRRRETAAVAIEPAASLADLLRDRLTRASDNQLPTQQYAELERMLFTFWRKRLGLEDQPVDHAMRAIKGDNQAGPLMTQLETWMHQPVASDRNDRVNLAELLQPYKNIPIEELDGGTLIRESQNHVTPGVRS